MAGHDDKWARKVLLAVWPTGHGTPTLAALQTVQAVGRFEGRYGYPGGDAAWQGSHNWGAIQEPHPTPENSFEHRDSDASGNEYVAHFRKYATDEDGARDLVHELMRRPGVLAVLDSGDAARVAQAMRASGYFESPAASYARNLTSNAEHIARALGEACAVGIGGAPAPGGAARAGSHEGLGVVGLGTLALGAWLVWRAMKRRAYAP